MSLAQFGQSIKAKHPEYADIPDMELGQKVLTKYPQYADMVDTSMATISKPPSLLSPAGLKSAMYTAVDKGSRLLPAIGATIGAAAGMTGGPFSPLTSAGGAALGGGAGKAAEQLTRRAMGYENTPQTSMDAAKQIGKEGAIQGALELATAGTARLAKNLAPALAETSLGITERMRGSGRSIGETALRETSSVRPASLAKEAQGKLSNLTSTMESNVNQATAAGKVGSTVDAHAALDAVIAKTPRNATGIVSKLNELRDKLYLDPANKVTSFTPTDLLEMKRGIGEEIKTWPLEWQKNDKVKMAQQRLYGAIDKEIDKLVPGNDALNQTISSLIPVKSQAVRKSLQASTTQRVANRIAVHTGAAALGGVGSFFGEKAGGTSGAIVGGLAGLIAPEMASSPTARMAIARALYKSPEAQQYLTPAARLGLSQLLNEDDNNQPK